VIEFVDFFAIRKSVSKWCYLLHFKLESAITKVMPGSYTLRISPAQVSKLKLIATQERLIKVKPEGDFISGQDLQLKPSQN
jgi:hypothetical protein